jgi:tRNA A-37 threonylcarbamoyl transferase component Bud32
VTTGFYETMHLEPEVRVLFEEDGPLNKAARWAGPDGAQRLTAANGQVYYCKRGGREALRLALRPLVFGRRPLSGPLRELAMLQKLRAAGFRTMEPLAWGERRRWGLPVQGFLLVRAAGGEEVADLLEQWPPGPRDALWREIGVLLARLHLAGFFQPVRMKDLLRDASGLILIDRETSKPWRAFFRRGWCVKAIRRSLYRSRFADGKRPDVPEAFWEAYAATIAPRWAVAPEVLARQVREHTGSRA